MDPVPQFPQSLQLSLTSSKPHVGLNVGPLHLLEGLALGSVDLDLNDEGVDLDLAAGVPTFLLNFLSDFLPVVSDSLRRPHEKNKFLGRIVTFPGHWLDSVTGGGVGGG